MKMKTLLIVALVAIGASLAISQDQPPPPDGGGRDQQRRQGQFNPDQVRQFQAARQGMQQGSLFATEKFVYVLKGDTLYQFRASDLELVKKTTLPTTDNANQPPPGGR